MADLAPVIENRYPTRNVGMGWAIELEKPEEMVQKLIEFWQPTTQVIDYNFGFYIGIGNVLGPNLQNRLYRAGVTYMQGCGPDHKEYKITDPERGIAGRVDCILDMVKMKAWGAKTQKEIKDVPPEFKPFEIKSTSSNNYRSWEDTNKLPLKYRCQLSMYIKYLNYLDICKGNDGGFIIMSRDTPHSMKVLWYELEEDLIERAYKVTSEFWGYIQDRKFPDWAAPEYNKDWIQARINEQADRVWPELANLNTIFIGD